MNYGTQMICINQKGWYVGRNRIHGPNYKDIVTFSESLTKDGITYYEFIEYPDIMYNSKEFVPLIGNEDMLVDDSQISELVEISKELVAA